VTRSIPLVTGLAIVVAVAVVQGVWTQRWQKSAELEAAVERLSRAPGNLATWTAETSDLDDDLLASAGAQGAWLRRYTDARTGASVQIIVLCGKPGKMSVHRPEYCYRGAGYNMLADPIRYQIPAEPPAECWTTKFRKEEPTGDVALRIFWTWFGDGVWRAPDSPRLAFAHLPALYKLYAIRELPSRPERLEQDPTLDLLERLLPCLAEALAGYDNGRLTQ
jgi:hypothetical protein